MLKAVIFKGNPRFVTNNPVADEFYVIIKEFLEKSGYDVLVQEPMNHSTEHEEAHLWIGHSMGGWYISMNGPAHIRKVIIGSRVAGSLYHPKDNVITSVYWKEPNEYHYRLTKEMEEEILKVTEEIRSEFLG